MNKDAKKKTEMIFPCFEINSENILFLDGPNEYYESLKPRNESLFRLFI